MSGALYYVADALIAAIALSTALCLYLEWKHPRVEPATPVAPPGPGRRARAWWKVSIRWLTGALTDPHTKWSSACRVVGVGTGLALCIYVISCPFLHEKPDPLVCTSLGGTCAAALGFRARSTQQGTVVTSRPGPPRDTAEPPEAS